VRRVLDIGAATVLPAADDVLAQQGVPAVSAEQDALVEVAVAAVANLAATISPAGVLEEVAIPDFATVYAGAGNNDVQTPLQPIFTRAERLFLFAVTCGAAVSERIAAAFARHDYPLAAALDAAASLAADRCAQVAQDEAEASVRTAAPADPHGLTALRYSPGYCGWHISGQAALLARLAPAEAGITLTAAYVMRPLKSVSGVVVVGRPGIHRFTRAYPCCAGCTEQTCRERLGVSGPRPGRMI
jgi:hypothetical protein